MCALYSAFSVLLVALASFQPQLSHARPLNSPRVANIHAISTRDLGRTSDPLFNPNIYRDGGGGGLVNGYHVVAFSDTTTTSGGAGGTMTSMVHNTVAYFGHRDPTNPAALTDIGNFQQSQGQRTFVDATFGPADATETALGVNFGIWPNANLINIPGTSQLVGVYQCQQFSNGVASLLYNTLAVLDVTPPPATGAVELQATRPVPQLFQANEPQYGSFSLKRHGKWLYMFATNDKQGVRVARVPVKSMTDKTQYTYWTGSQWSSQMPALSDTSVDILHWGGYGIGSGDVFWSRHYNTLVMAFQPVASAQMYMSYSTTGTVEGPWSTPKPFATFTVDPGCPPGGYTYNGHAYPHWDPSGKTLLLSWASCANYVRMAQVTFA